MLSLYTLKSAKDASTYYQQGDYYTAAGTDEYSFWWGKGAKALELQGSVDFKVFKDLLKGHLPNQETMVQTQKGQYHRPGYDLTFSAPKSVSILALVLGNKEILEAHRQAVKGVLSHLEKEEAAFRLKVKGHTQVLKTGNYTVAAFEHSDSRAGDPNLHTHAVLLNMTQRKGGAWRALYADNLYTDKLFHGMEYRSLLARQLLQLGFELDLKDKGLFEIVGIPETLMKQWSQRREEIETWLKEQHLTGGEASTKANFQTRTAKVKENPKDRMNKWLVELKEAGVSLEDLQKIVFEAKERGPVSLPDPMVLATYAVNAAIHHLSERQASFSVETLMKTAKWMSILPCSEGDFLKVIEHKIEAKTLLYGEGKLLTTFDTILLQEQIVESLKNQTQVNRIFAPWMANGVLAFKGKGIEEHQTLKALFTATESQVLVSASSRRALWTLLKDFKSLAEYQGYYPRVLTQTQLGVERLKEKLGTERVNTLAGFLLACEKRAARQKSVLPHWLKVWDERVKAFDARDIWIVEGAILPQELHLLQQWSKRFNARMILTETSHQPIPLYSFLKEKGIRSTHLQSPTKETNPKMVALEKLESLEKEQRLYVVADYKERLQKMVELYEPQTQLLCSLAAECRFLNQAVRGPLKVQGVLSGQSTMLTTLQPLALSRAEKN